MGKTTYFFIILFYFSISVKNLEIYVDPSSNEVPEGTKLRPFVDLNSAFQTIGPINFLFITLRNEIQIQNIEIASVNATLKFFS